MRRRASNSVLVLHDKTHLSLLRHDDCYLSEKGKVKSDILFWNIQVLSVVGGSNSVVTKGRYVGKFGWSNIVKILISAWSLFSATYNWININSNWAARVRQKSQFSLWSSLCICLLENISFAEQNTKCLVCVAPFLFFFFFFLQSSQ